MIIIIICWFIPYPALSCSKVVGKYYTCDCIALSLCNSLFYLSIIFIIAMALLMFLFTCVFYFYSIFITIFFIIFISIIIFNFLAQQRVELIKKTLQKFPIVCMMRITNIVFWSAMFLVIFYLFFLFISLFYIFSIFFF